MVSADLSSGGQSGRECFARAEALLLEGDIEAAAEAFRAIPDLEALLAQPAPDGRPVPGPDFIIIGAPRGGTSWLKRVLKRHPDVFLPPGEPHYFWRGLDRSPIAYVADLARQVDGASARPVIGEKSPAYLTISNDRIALCASLFPRLKLVCHVRDPVDRAWSMIRRLEAFSQDATPDAIDVEGTVRELQRIVQFGFYRRHLRRWGAHFPPERFLVLDFDRIGKEPDAIYQQVLLHIGASSHKPAMPEGPGPAPPVPDAIRAALEDAYRDEPWDIACLKRALREGGGAVPEADTALIKSRSRLAAWRLMLESAAGHATAHARLASVLAAAGRAEEAIEHLEALIRLEPAPVGHRRLLAKLLQAAGPPTRAIDAWLSLLEIVPGDLQAHANLARLYAGGGLYAQAAPHFRAEAEADAANGDAWRRLATCLRKIGDDAGELHALTQALRIVRGEPKLRARAETLRRQMTFSAGNVPQQPPLH